MESVSRGEWREGNCRREGGEGESGGCGESDVFSLALVVAALVIGNYGLWNAYTVVTALLYVPVRGQFGCVCSQLQHVILNPYPPPLLLLSTGLEGEGDSTSEAAQKLLTKPSAE